MLFLIVKSTLQFTKSNNKGCVDEFYFQPRNKLFQTSQISHCSGYLSTDIKYAYYNPVNNGEVKQHHNGSAAHSVAYI